MEKYRIKYRHNPTGLIKVFTVEAKNPNEAKTIIETKWDGSVMVMEFLNQNKRSK